MSKVKLFAGVVAAGVLGLCSTSAQAALLTPEADAFVRGGSSNQNTNFGSALSVPVKPGNDLSFNRRGYVRFDVSSLSAGVTAATLTIEGSFDNGDVNGAPLTIWGLNDGNAGENWGESTITWLNAPANLNSNSGTGIDASEATLLGSYADGSDVPSGGGAATFTFDDVALVNFLNADTDGLATLIFVAASQGPSPISFRFDSKEATGGSGLTLDATVIPEPASAGLIGAGMLLLAARRRR
ncbi:MAG: DNRLRE domain-containing protein [Planctomycetota bacterium]